MTVQLQRLNDAFHFEARNEEGASIHLDSSPDAGGQNLGFRPMQTLLAALASCSSIDIGLILGKQRLQIDDFQVQVDAERRQDMTPAIFEKIHVHYHLRGELPPEKVGRAIELSLSTYCSVAHILRATAVITYTYQVNDAFFEPGAAS
jgi:putative redox protein